MLRLIPTSLGLTLSRCYYMSGDSNIELEIYMLVNIFNDVPSMQ